MTDPSTQIPSDIRDLTEQLWNSISDQYNSWGHLGEDERHAYCALMSAARASLQAELEKVKAERDEAQAEIATLRKALEAIEALPRYSMQDALENENDMQMIARRSLRSQAEETR